VKPSAGKRDGRAVVVNELDRAEIDRQLVALREIALRLERFLALSADPHHQGLSRPRRRPAGLRSTPRSRRRRRRAIRTRFLVHTPENSIRPDRTFGNHSRRSCPKHLK
jgi:hypothetical protein